MKTTYLAVISAAAMGLFACGSESDTKKKDAGPTQGEAGIDTPQADAAQPPDTAAEAQKPDVPLDAPQSEAAPVDGKAIDGEAIDGAAIDGGAIDGGITMIDGQPFNSAFVQLDPAKFQGVVDGKNTALYTIRNSKGMSASITNLGAKIEQIAVPDRNGVFGDVVLGYESVDAVKNGQGSMGAFVGRYANRIGDGTFTLDGTKYSIAVNEAAPKNNLLHGGAKGSRFRVFDATQLSGSSVQMSLTFLDAEDADAANGLTGFPGTLEMKVTYTVTEANELNVEYSAKTLDKKTVINFTAHSFFNLGNSPTTPILDHVVKVNAAEVLEINDRLLPTGVLRDVTGTPMDFRTAKAFGKDYQVDYDLLKLVGGGGTNIAGGYDNHYKLIKPTAGELTFAASAYEPVSGRVMEVWSTEPGMQLFTGTNLTGQAPRDTGKGGVLYQKYYGFCMEPSHFPDSPNQPAFPTTTINPGENYQGKIIYKFKVQ
jgi:aldose 1-epimerase